MRFSFSVCGAAAAMVVVLASPATAQSFSCGGNLTATESAICNSNLISSLDMMMAHLYKEVRSVSSKAEAAALQTAQRDWLKKRDACGADAECLTTAYIDRVDTIWKGRDSLADWTGIYNGPSGENEIEVRQTSSGGLEFHLLGGTANYICDYGPAVAEVQGQTAVISAEGDELTLRRVGTGFYVPASASNAKALQSHCGARAPDLTDQFFPVQGSATPRGRAG